MEKSNNLLIPILGKSKRFKEKGFLQPKPSIFVGNKQIIDWSMNSICHENFNIIFVVREDDCINFGFDSFLLRKFPESKIIKINEDTCGAVESCLFAMNYINNDTPLTIFTLDVSFLPQFNGIVKEDIDGRILTFSSTDSNYSYSEIDPETNLVVQVAEKQVISTNASAGIYWFKSGRMFVQGAQDFLKFRNLKEYHIAPLYNILVNQGKKIDIEPVESIYIMGTPEEKEFIESIIVDEKLPIGLVSDHSGWDTKNKFIEFLLSRNIDYIDFGCYTDDQCNYSDYVPVICDSIRKKRIKYGFGFCRTGQGINIAANKQAGIRSALVSDSYTARYAVMHNAANFFCVPEFAVNDLSMIFQGIDKSTFLGGRHQMRVSSTMNY